VAWFSPERFFPQSGSLSDRIPGNLERNLCLSHLHTPLSGESEDGSFSGSHSFLPTPSAVLMVRFPVGNEEETKWASLIRDPLPQVGDKCLC